MHRPLGLGQKSDPDHGERSHPHHTVQVCSGVGASAWGGAGRQGSRGPRCQQSRQSLLAILIQPPPTVALVGGMELEGEAGREEKKQIPPQPPFHSHWWVLPSLRNPLLSSSTCWLEAALTHSPLRSLCFLGLRRWCSCQEGGSGDSPTRFSVVLLVCSP